MSYSDDDTRELLANIGQFDGGELKFNLPGQDDLKSAAELTTEEISTLKETFQLNNLSSEDLARQQLTVLQDIEATLKEPAKRIIGGIAATEQFEQLESRLKETAGDISKVVGNTLTPENVQKAFEVTDDIFRDGAQIFSDAFSAYSERGAVGLGQAIGASFNNSLSSMNLSGVTLPSMGNVGLPSLPSWVEVLVEVFHRVVSQRLMWQK